MEDKLIPQDIQDDADSKYVKLTYYTGLDTYTRPSPVELAYIQGRLDERAKGNWTDDDLFDAMEFIGTCPISSNADLIKWWKYFMIKQKEKNDN